MKRIIALILVVVMLSATFSVSFAGDVAELRSVKISGVYHQNQARTLLNKVNDFRLNKVSSTDSSKYLGDQAWAWNYGYDKNGKLYYYKQAYSSLKAYTYDYELEQIAMQRAAEIAVYYGNDHTRPNNTSWRTAHTVYNPATNVSIGENIFATTNCDVMESINYAFDWWLESNDPYEGQSHRRNLLGVSVDVPFVSTAFACFEVNEVFYWVELFRSVNVNPSATSVSIEKTTKNVILSDVFIKSIAYTPVSESINLKIGQSKTILPEGNLISTNHILSYQEVSTGKMVQVPTVINVEATLKSSNTSVVSVSGTTIKAVGAGTATITATAFGKSIQYTVNVQKSDISSALITFKDDIDTYIYSGKEIKPPIQSVTVGSTVLNSSDYDVTYADNIEVGTGVIAISGKGNYEGAVTKAFNIILREDCPHSIVYDPAVAGNCLVKGKTSGTHCKICGKVFEKQEETDFGPHKEKITIEAKEPTCTENGTTQEVICITCGRFIKEAVTIPALGHDYPASYTTAKATLSKNGSVYRICSRCDGKDVKKTIYYPKTFTLSKTAFTYNGKVQKPKLTVKGSDGKTISASNFTYSIPNGKKVGRYKITIKFKGNYSGTKTLYYDILPKNTSKFVLSSAKKAFKVKWNTQKNQTKGYQIQYSLYSNFKNAKTFTLKNNKYNAATISKLTGGKKYYVRMRTYGTVKYGGKSINLFSAWSGKKSVTTKK